MHPYTTQESRVALYGGLATLSVAVSWLITALSSSLSWPQWLISGPSVAGTFALLYWTFDRYAWRWVWARAIGRVNVADIAGTYEGKLVSTYEDQTGQSTEIELRLEISQTWTRMSVEMTLEHQSSSSSSISALGSVIREGSATRLTYIYRNRINPAVADADMGDHDGAADLLIYADGRLTGRYFNVRPRAGTIEAQKQA